MKNNTGLKTGVIQELDKRLLELTDLFEISQTLNSTLKIQSVMDNLLRIPMGKMMINKGIAVIKQEKDEYVVDSLKGIRRDLLGKSINIPDFPSHPFFLDEVDSNNDWITFFKEFDIKILVPLNVKNDVVGLIGYGKKIIGSEFNEADIDFLVSLSNIGATAVENALVHETLKKTNIQLDRSIQELNTIFEISREFNSTLDSEKIIKLLSFTLMGQMMVKKLAVMLNENDSIKLKSTKGIKKEELISAEKELNDCFSNQISLNTPYLVGDNAGNPFETWLKKRDFIAVIPMINQDELKGMIILGKRIDGKIYKREDLNFLYTLGNQAMVAIENARLFEEMLEKQRMEEDLQVARGIQKKLLPKSIPLIDGFSVKADNISSKQVGGDYYDVFRINESIIGVCIADVSGKGVPASLLMSNLQASLRSLAPVKKSIGEMVVTINELLFENTDYDKYITFFYGEIDLNKNIFRFTNGGHNPPILLHPDSSFYFLEKGGIPIGMMGGMKYEEEEVQLSKGDRLVLYTDGINEAMDIDEEEYGEEKLYALIKKNVEFSAEDLFDSILEDVNKHVNNAPQSDDVTLMVIGVNK